MRPSTILMFTLLVGLTSSCATECVCPIGHSCDAEGECVPECTVEADCPISSCAPEFECCDPQLACDSGQCVRRSLALEFCGPPPKVADGWDDAPGSGRSFVVNSINIAERPLVNIDGRCDEDGCLDNAFAPVGELANDQLRQDLLGGGNIIGIEIAGLHPDYDGFDRSVTVKVYSLRDADDPFFPANNFSIPPGHSTCCEFLIYPGGLQGGATPQARVRIPAQIRNGRLFSLETDSPAQFELTYGVPPFPQMEFARVSFGATLPADLSELQEVVLSGAWTARSLSQTCNPYCTTRSPRCVEAFAEGSTMLDFARVFAGEADVDVDGDGIECVYDRDGDGAIDTCCEGRGAQQCSATPCAVPVPAMIPGEPASCAAAPSMNDGYSVTFEIKGRPASLVGTAR